MFSCCCCGGKPWQYYVLLFFFCSGEGESVHIDNKCDATGLLGDPLRFGVVMDLMVVFSNVHRREL